MNGCVVSVPRHIIVNLRLNFCHVGLNLEPEAPAGTQVVASTLNPAPMIYDCTLDKVKAAGIRFLEQRWMGKFLPCCVTLVIYLFI